MYRSMSRMVGVCVIVCSILAFVPVVEARPLAQPALGVDRSWLDVALSWLQRLLPETPQQPLASAPAAATKSSGTYDGSLLVPNTGSCIDPNGSPRPWCSS